jgi:hypothetical protein
MKQERCLQYLEIYFPSLRNRSAQQNKNKGKEGRKGVREKDMKGITFL